MPTLHNVSCRYGAPMGRPSRGYSGIAPRKFTLQRLPLDRGGYDRGGAYWGTGAPLYWATCEEAAVELFFRAADRAAAKAEVTRRYKGAKFYR